MWKDRRVYQIFSLHCFRLAPKTAAYVKRCLLVLALACSCPEIRADVVDWLYHVEVPVATQSASETQAAAARAFVAASSSHRLAASSSSASRRSPPGKTSMKFDTSRPPEVSQPEVLQATRLELDSLPGLSPLPRFTHSTRLSRLTRLYPNDLWMQKSDFTKMQCFLWENRHFGC